MFGVLKMVFLAVSNVKLGDAALISLLGFTLVVGVLIILVCLFYLSGFIFKQIDKHQADKQAAIAPSVSPSNMSVSDDDEEVVAAIIAAVSVILSEETQAVEPPPFIVKSIKPLD